MAWKGSSSSKYTRCGCADRRPDCQQLQLVAGAVLVISSREPLQDEKFHPDLQPLWHGLHCHCHCHRPGQGAAAGMQHIAFPTDPKQDVYNQSHDAQHNQHCGHHWRYDHYGGPCMLSEQSCSLLCMCITDSERVGVVDKGLAHPVLHIRILQHKRLMAAIPLR